MRSILASPLLDQGQEEAVLWLLRRAQAGEDVYTYRAGLHDQRHFVWLHNRRLTLAEFVQWFEQHQPDARERQEGETPS